MKGIYIEVLMSWGRKLFREPHQWLMVSLVFTLLVLPVVTIGPAMAVAAWLARQYALEYKVQPLKEARLILKQCFWKALWMGLLDLVFAVTLAVTVLQLLAGTGSLLGYALFALLDVLFLLSGYYRYPMLVCNPEMSLWSVLVTGLQLVANNLGLLLMLFSVDMLVLIVSAVTGFGILLVFPGATAFLSMYLYQYNLRKYGKKNALQAE